MDPELKTRFDALEKKIDDMYKTVERLRKYFKWTLIFGIVTVVLPLIGLAFVIPFYLSTLTNYTGMGL